MHTSAHASHHFQAEAHTLIVTHRYPPDRPFGSTQAWPLSRRKPRPLMPDGYPSEWFLALLTVEQPRPLMPDGYPSDWFLALRTVEQISSESEGFHSPSAKPPQVPLAFAGDPSRLSRCIAARFSSLASHVSSVPLSSSFAGQERFTLYEPCNYEWSPC